MFILNPSSMAYKPCYFRISDRQPDFSGDSFRAFEDKLVRLPWYSYNKVMRLLGRYYNS